MIGYKGFDKDFKCRDFQYEIGKTYKHDGELRLCESGFHFCTNPLAVFGYYAPNNNRFALVEATGKIIANGRLFCTDELVIVKELSLDEMIAAATNTGYRSVATNTGNCSAATDTGIRSVATNTGDWSVATNTGNCSAATNTGNCSAATNTGDCSAATNTGYQSVATNTGYQSVATNTGDWSVATNTGDCSAATNTGYQSVATNTGNCSAATNTGDYSAACVAGEQSLAVVIGRDSKAKGALGCWLTLAEWRDDHIIDVQTFKIDGERIQADTFYTLKDGKPVKVDD